MLGAVVASATLATVLTPLSANAAPSSAKAERYVVIAKSSGGYASLRDRAVRDGATVHDMHGTRTLAVDATPAVAARIESSGLAATVVKDGVKSLIDPDSSAEEMARKLAAGPQSANKPARHPRRIPAAAQDPAAGLPGLMWNQDRIRSPQANAVTYGSSAVTVAVADTGLDYQHAELSGRVTGVVDFTTTEDPPLCQSAYGKSDADLAAEFGAPADSDWNGHGTWIGGNIAANLDKTGINGIAPKVNLVSLKVSQWCGSAYDSELLAAFEYAAAHKIDVVSISFGGYADRSNPDDEAIYQQYVQTVAEARKAGTLIVASAGNEHVRIGAGGRVLSHGSFNVPGDELQDLYGLYETPGGVPGVLNVSSTGNVVAEPSADCPDEEGLAVTCKPSTDAHQAAGIGKKDQLAYYSNYGPRIDLAAPGGARKFNMPVWDRGGTPGWPVTEADGYTAYQEFSITSNLAVYTGTMPCYQLTGSTFPEGQCYTTIQGTSMATPHVSAAAALVASAKPKLRHRPAAIAYTLKATANRHVRNYTQPLSATDTSEAEIDGYGACPSGYCHLGGRAIRSREAYGAGVVDTARAVR
jgi:lantibiotic leader peptide-processing serine protease